MQRIFENTISYTQRQLRFDWYCFFHRNRCLDFWELSVCCSQSQPDFALDIWLIICFNLEQLSPVDFSMVHGKIFCFYRIIMELLQTSRILFIMTYLNLIVSWGLCIRFEMLVPFLKGRPRVWLSTCSTSSFSIISYAKYPFAV
jgi:hypothetical protein